jgi:hypothetical protein
VLRKAYLNAMKGLEAGLKVRDIAVFDLSDCAPDERVGVVRGRVDRYDFDNVPVRDTGIIGVLEDIKTYSPDDRVRDVMTPLAEPMLIAGSLSLVSFLPRIAERPYRLVVDEEHIGGVVTPSDVVQLPVRLLVFTLLVHLEETMRDLIRYRVGDDGERILSALEADPRRRIERLLERHARSNLNPSPLDVTGFMDKANLLFDLRVIPEGDGERDLFREFRELRNKVDHVQDYGESRQQLSRFLFLVQAMQQWIERLTQEFPPATPAVPVEVA